MFNKRGFVEVSIDDVMAEAGLTRGGFYNHFKTKEDLFIEAVGDYGRCNPADNWEGQELDFSASGQILAEQLIGAYLSPAHLADVANHCPMIALPSDVARASPQVKQAYRELFERMVTVFETGLPPKKDQAARERALGLAALCIGGMVLARTFDDREFSGEIRQATHGLALEVAGFSQEPEPAVRAAS